MTRWPRSASLARAVAVAAVAFGLASCRRASTLVLIGEGLGEFPLIGFFANGEISRDRLYGHTGVLTLFA